MPKKRRHGAPRTLHAQVAPREGGGLALTVGGVTQSISLPTGVGETGETGETDETRGADDPRSDYWGLMLPPGCPQRALLLGLGGGTVATLLARRCPAVEMIGVERDQAVLALARDLFGLDDIAGLRVVIADAFDWVAAQFAAESTLAEGVARYDLICVDLFEAGRMVAGTLATPFLRQIAALLAPGGVASINLMVTGRTPEHLHRLRRVFRVERERRLRGNLVLHLTPLPRNQWTAEAQPPIM